MKELLFIECVFRAGMNVTVRRGDKWATTLIGGELVKLKKTGADFESGIGKIYGVALIPFLLIPNDWLRLEHDPSCTDMEGLLAAMKRAYPDFRTDEYVSVVLFERL